MDVVVRVWLDRAPNSGKDGLTDEPCTLHREPLEVNVISEPKRTLSEPKIVQSGSLIEGVNGSW
jgi:hypothetical protein